MTAAILLLAALTAQPTRAQATAHPVEYGSIRIDGDASDPGWSGIEPWGEFVQQDPLEGAAPSEATEFRFAYDKTAVYVLVEAHDSAPDRIVGQLTRRDAESRSDWIHVWLDTHDDHRTAYRFSLNPAGVKQDARVFDDVEEDVAWDAVWDASARTSSSGWTAELRIPFSQLRYEADRSRWGLEVRREIVRAGEKSDFSLIPQTSDRLVSHFGALDGLEDLPESRGITAAPYGLASYTHAGEASTGWAVGGDARIPMGSSFALDLTVYPDFGQVEADPSVLNLSATETYFDERRPFFVEGQETLRFPIAFGDGDLGRESLFYSRRIGEETLLGAAKLTGKSGGWTVGLLDAVSGGVADEPLSNSAVARVQRDFGEGATTLGLTGTDKLAVSESAGLDHALGTGADITHRVGHFGLSAKLYLTYLAGSPEALAQVQRSSVHYFQRPDAPHLRFDPARESLLGYGATFVAGKLDGPTWRSAVGLLLQSPGLDTNPLGYLPAADQQIGFAWIQLRDDTAGAVFRRTMVNVNAFGARTFGSEVTGLGGNVNGTAVFTNQSLVFAGVSRQLETLDVTALRGGPGLLVPGRSEAWIGGSTDPRRAVRVELEAGGSLRDFEAGSRAGVTLTASLRPTSSIEISLAPTFEHAVDAAQYAGAVGEEAVVAELVQDTVSLAARADWTLSPALSVQLYAAPFLSAGTYTDFKSVTSPRADQWDDRFRPAAPNGPDRFRFLELRSNLVVRWEYATGSTLFAVWSHAQTNSDENHGSLSVGRDLADLASATPTETVMIKLSHWLEI